MQVCIQHFSSLESNYNQAYYKVQIEDDGVVLPSCGALWTQVDNSDLEKHTVFEIWCLPMSLLDVTTQKNNNIVTLKSIVATNASFYCQF